MSNERVNYWKRFGVCQRHGNLVVFTERDDGAQFHVSIALDTTTLSHVEGLLTIAIERLHNEAGVR